MTTSTEWKPGTIAELADYVANNYGRLGTKAMRESWIAVLASILFDDAFEAVEKWMRNNSNRMPLPKDIRDAAQKEREKRTATTSTTAIICQWCGEIVAFEHDPWRCMRERPKLDRTEARLRGLKNSNPTDERRRELEHHINSKGGRAVHEPRGVEEVQESF